MAREDARPTGIKASTTMRQLPIRGSRGRRWTPERRFRGWRATWLQDRRRRRQAGELPPLEVGLLEFYQPYAGATALRSWNEPEHPPDNLLAGLVSPAQSAAAGPYVSGNYVWYQVHPYRAVGGGRLYPGLSLDQGCPISLATAAVSWPMWSAVPDWASGCVVVRWVNWGTYDYRDLSLGAMTAGWTDDGTGWSAANTLPAGFSTPPRVAKVMWNRLAHGPPTPLPTVLSPLGGAAFDSTFGDQLARNFAEALRRSLAGTMAYWLCPGAGTSGVLSSVRGFYEYTFLGQYDCAPPDLALGDFGELSVADHVDGDWYLVVLRSDPLLDEYQINLLRLRDGTPFAGSSPLHGTALAADSDYFREGLMATLVLGGSWHGDVPGYGYFDRLGVWNRVLTDDEILDLFNSGLGWQPG